MLTWASPFFALKKCCSSEEWAGFETPRDVLYFGTKLKLHTKIALIFVVKIYGAHGVRTEKLLIITSLVKRLEGEKHTKRQKNPVGVWKALVKSRSFFFFSSLLK